MKVSTLFMLTLIITQQHHYLTLQIIKFTINRFSVLHDLDHLTAVLETQVGDTSFQT